MSFAAVTKMHGTFNDFVVLDLRAGEVPDLSGFARAVCDRRGGVGADGLIVLAASAKAHAKMRIINADGSEAEMCGNGMRCAIRYLSELGEGDRFVIETLSGDISAQVVSKGEAYEVRLEMGEPEMVSAELPFPNSCFVSVGNPHVVIFRDSLEDFDLVAAGKRAPQYNVHAVVVANRHRIEARHYERGVGLTCACGTGAVACVAAAIERGLCDSPVDVHVPGGILHVEWTKGKPAFLTGPAVRVFDARLCETHAVPI